MRHIPTVRRAQTAYQGACSCGWVSPSTRPEEQSALLDASAHSTREINRCGKVKFRNESAARDAVVKAKIAAALHSNKRRHESRAYRCVICDMWHLTSKPWRPAAAIARALAAGQPVTQIMVELDVDYEVVKEIRDQMVAAR